MKRVLPILWVFIIAVCALDVFLSVKFAKELPAYELNPMGQFLLALDNGEPALLISTKWVTDLLLMLYLILKPNVLNTCAIAGVQLALLFVFWS